METMEPDLSLPTKALKAAISISSRKVIKIISKKNSDYHLLKEADLQRVIMDTIKTQNRGNHMLTSAKMLLHSSPKRFSIPHSNIPGQSYTSFYPFTRVCEAPSWINDAQIPCIYHEKEWWCSEDSFLSDTYAITATYPMPHQISGQRKKYKKHMYQIYWMTLVSSQGWTITLILIRMYDPRGQLLGQGQCTRRRIQRAHWQNASKWSICTSTQIHNMD